MTTTTEAPEVTTTTYEVGGHTYTVGSELALPEEIQVLMKELEHTSEVLNGELEQLTTAALAGEEGYDFTTAFTQTIQGLRDQRAFLTSKLRRELYNHFGGFLPVVYNLVEDKYVAIVRELGPNESLSTPNEAIFNAAGVTTISRPAYAILGRLLGAQGSADVEYNPRINCAGLQDLGMVGVVAAAVKEPIIHPTSINKLTGNDTFTSCIRAFVDTYTASPAGVQREFPLLILALGPECTTLAAIAASKARMDTADAAISYVRTETFKGDDGMKEGSIITMVFQQDTTGEPAGKLQVSVVHGTPSDNETAQVVYTVNAAGESEMVEFLNKEKLTQLTQKLREEMGQNG